MNTAAVERPELITEIADEFGAQCVVVAIDARGRRDGTGGWEVFTHGGRTADRLDAIAWAAGSRRGWARARSCSRRWTATARARASTSSSRVPVTDAVDVPVIASGGVGSLDHLVEGVLEGGADAVLAASIFHFGEHTVAEAKQVLAARGVTVRPVAA